MVLIVQNNPLNGPIHPSTELGIVNIFVMKFIIMKSLSAKLQTVSDTEWFEKHTLVSAEDFQKEPHRNKLNVLLT